MSEANNRLNDPRYNHTLPVIFNQKVDFIVAGFQILKRYNVTNIYVKVHGDHHKIFVDIESKVTMQDLGELVHNRWYKENDNRWWTSTDEPGWD